jgi:hypothetical protein
MGCITDLTSNQPGQSAIGVTKPSDEPAPPSLFVMDATLDVTVREFGPFASGLDTLMLEFTLDLI